MAAASANLDDVSAELKAVSRQLKASKRSRRSANSRIMRDLRCHATVKIACVIFALTAPRTDLALEFLKFKRRNKPDANEWTQTHLLDRFNEFTSMEKELMLDATDKTWNRHLATAKAWLRDNGLRDWVYSQNKNKGIAPANDLVWKQSIARLAKDDPGALRPEKRPRWKRRQVNQWVLRWANRARVLRGAFKDGERLPLETLQAKVVGPISLRPNGDSWPKSWPQKGAQKTVPKMMTMIHFLL